MIPVRNIYYMLAYAYRGLTFSGVSDVEIENFDNAADLFAAILSKGVATQVKRGLERAYLESTEALSAPKGKIDISKSIPMCATHSRRLVCNYDEFSEDTYPNQVLKTTLLYLLRSQYVLLPRKKQIKRSLLFFSKVSVLRPNRIDWSRIRINRVNASYKTLINLCYIVLEGMLQTTEAGSIKLTNIIDDQRMSILYEHFVLEYYRRHFPELNATPSFVPWDTDDGFTEFLPAMKTDITLCLGERVLIIDTKYYGSTMQTNPFFNSRTVHSGNLYQVYSYVKNKDKSHSGLVSGMLLYAKTDEEITPNTTYHMGGNTITVKTLDLNCEFMEISQQLNGIVEENFA